MDPGLVSLSLSLSLNGRDVHMSGSPCASGMLITASCLGGVGDVLRHAGWCREFISH